ncbi:MAG: hypothetical protein NTW26_10345 [bacterium]|nr:hypothetical protein [bacterium]
MKTLVFFTVLAAAVCLAGNAVSVSPEPPSEYNAHWRLISDGLVGCVRDGTNVYGSNDNAYLSFSGFTDNPISIYGYDGVLMRINYSQESADDGDYCTVYVYDSDFECCLAHEFEDTDGTRTAQLMLDGLYGTRDLRIDFKWVSDSTGVDEGFRMHDIEISGCVWGEGEYTNIFTWGESNDVTDHQNLDVTDMRYGNMSCLAFEYSTDLDTQGWWAVDNVDLTADGESILPLQAGGYGVEDFENGGWHQDQHGLSGEWETDTDHAAGDMSGANWQCDSAANPGSLYEAETFTPWVAGGGTGTFTLDFDTWFHPLGTGESASLGFYEADVDTVYHEVFHDLDDWITDDYGSNVVDTSWGAIKASF